MTERTPRSVVELFKRWRGGDAAAGQTMAQRFSDWYYAISVSRLGERRGRAPLQAACENFAQRISTVNQSNLLVDWAHDLLHEELRPAGSRIPGADDPHSIARKRPPSEAILEVAPSLSQAHLSLLHHAYAGDTPSEDLVEEAEQAGGYPLAILHARNALKQALVEELDIPFRVVPRNPRLDCAPLPLYEADRLRSPQEEARFEKWILGEMEVCRDLAEFAPFALALRTGVLGPEVRTGVADPPATGSDPHPPSSSRPGAPPARQPLGRLFLVLLAVAGVVVLLVYLVTRLS